MIARLCMMVIVFLMALSSATLSQPAAPRVLGTQSTQSTPIPGSEQEQTTQDKQNAAGSPALQHGANETPNHQGGGRDRGSGSDGERITHFGSYTPDEVTAAFTIALAIATFALMAATIFLAVATWGLYKQTKNLADQARIAGEDAKASIEIAKSAADASIISAKISQDALGADRAWVVTGELKVNPRKNTQINGIDVGRTLHFSFTAVNAGKTPAFNVNFWVAAEFCEVGEQIDFGKPREGSENIDAFMSPGFVADGRSITIHGEQLDKFRSGQIICYYAIYLTYYTSFDDVKKVSEMVGPISCLSCDLTDSGEENYTLVMAFDKFVVT